MKRILVNFALAILAIVLALLSGCVTRTDISAFQANPLNYTGNDTTYVEISPPWTGFVSPRAIIVGSDQLIYVADYGANEIIMMDAGGTVLKRRSILHPTAIAQNSILDLYVTGETISPYGGDTIGAVFKIDLERFDTSYVVHIDTTLDLTNAPMHIVWSEAGYPNRRFTGVGILPGNAYLVTRDGPSNTSPVDPDSRILRFSAGDTLITDVPDVTTRASGGSSITDILHLTSIFVLPSLYDFIFTQSSQGGITFGAVWMTYTSNFNFQGWLPEWDPSNAEQRGIDFVAPYRYTDAVAVGYDNKSREIFILDAALDSVSKFNSQGAFESSSFGRALTGANGLPPLNHPMGIAHSDNCTLYISDTGNGIVRRFHLSSQTTCF
jgi:hypothetical protein